MFFFASGASGLIYQVAWVRILSLIFGITVHAVSMVLAGFMAGLALGSFLAGRLAGKVRNPLLAYGVIEIAIGAMGVLTPAAFGALRDAFPRMNVWIEASASAWASSPDTAHLLSVGARWLVAFVILLVPTTFMGATLPVMLRSTLIRGSSLGGGVSLLYAINTFGAIAGTVGAGFFLIAAYGVQASIHLAAALNLGIGVLAILLSQVVRGGAAMQDGPASATQQDNASQIAAAGAAARPTPGGAAPARALTVLGLAFALSGLCALGYEVVWFRLLALFAFESSTYAFTAMLATVLFGIAAGSYVVGPALDRLGRQINWWVVFALLELGIALCAVLSVTVLSHMDGILGAAIQRWPMLTSLAKEDHGWVLLASFAAIVPSMFLSGMTFPVAAKVYAGEGAGAERRVGSLYALNVLGAIAGSLLAGFWLMPTLDSQRSLTVLAMGSALAGGAALWVSPRVHLIIKGVLTVAGVVAFVQATRVTPDMYALLLPARFEGKEIVWYREGLESTVTIVKDNEGFITLHTNARGQARDEPSLVAFHRLLGHMPMALHPNPQRALIVGIGGGTTSGAVAIHPGVELDAAELSDASIEAVRLFAHVNYHFFDRPNVRIYQTDARNHLLLSGKKYHVISGDAIRPNDAGATNLYSVEYYRLTANALEEDGLMTQWIPPFSDFQYKLILRTFLAAFPYATMWQDGDLVIGSKSPITIDRAVLEAKFQDAQFKAAMTEVGIPDAVEFLKRFNADTAELKATVGEGPIITDDRPYIEFFRNLPVDEPPDMSHYSHDVSKILR